MRISYFAWVRELVGRGGEDVAFPAEVLTIGDALDHLAARGGGHAAALADRSRLRFAVDDAIAAQDSALSDAQELAIFPPMTGGLQ